MLRLVLPHLTLTETVQETVQVFVLLHRTPRLLCPLGIYFVLLSSDKLSWCSNNAIFWVRFLIASICLLTMELSERDISNSRMSPAKKMKLAGDSKPSAVAIEKSGLGNSAHASMITARASHRRE